MVLGQMVMSFTAIIDQFFAANLGTGAIATLGYANRIMALILGIGALAIGRATLPVFSTAQAKGSDHLRRVTAHWVRLMFALGTVAMLASWCLAPVGVKLLFEHGEFTAQDTSVVSSILRYGLIQIPFYFAGLVMVSKLASERKYHVMAIIGVIGMVVKVGFNFLILPNFGVGALMISTALMSVSNSVLLGILVFKNNDYAVS